MPDSRPARLRRPVYATARHVSRLADGQLRDLLSTGDGPERVWAAWALGTRTERRCVPDLVAALEREASEGVRRNLAVMLAGYGELDIVAGLARLDPSPLVRATAAAYLARCARRAAAGQGAADQALVDLVAGCLAAERHPMVRRALLGALPPDEAARQRHDEAASTAQRTVTADPAPLPALREIDNLPALLD